MNNKKISLPRTPAAWLEAVMNFIFFLCGMLAVGCVVLITVYMVLSGVPAIHKIGLFRFLFGTEWASTAADPKFGILPFLLSSIYGTLGAVIVLLLWLYLASMMLIMGAEFNSVLMALRRTEHMQEQKEKKTGGLLKKPREAEEQKGTEETQNATGES